MTGTLSLSLCRSLSFFLTISRTISLESHSKTVYRLLGLDGPGSFAWIVSFNSLCFLTASAPLMRNWIVQKLKYT